MNDATQILKPAPDSQYRLRPCKECKGDNVAYVEYAHPDGERWRVVCFDCGHTVDIGANERHAVQLAWNEETLA